MICQQKTRPTRENKRVKQYRQTKICDVKKNSKKNDLFWPSDKHILIDCELISTPFSCDRDKKAQSLAEVLAGQLGHEQSSGLARLGDGDILCQTCLNGF